MARFSDIIRDNERLKTENGKLFEENTRNSELLAAGRERIECLLKENQTLRGRLEAALTVIEIKKGAS
jgi:hypothetical protein